jgi:3-isopropylmalate/(R)-2-methylmalate dehydratase large subunit
MPMTLAEKIIAKHVGRPSVQPGEFVEAKVDICLGNDITAPLAIEQFEKLGFGKVFDAERICLVPDHSTPSKDIKSAQQVATLRQFVQKYNIKHWWEVGRAGIEHSLLPEQGVVLPGDLIIGADSHTCTYGAIGAFSTGVGSTDLTACFATGKIWLRVPSTIRVIYEGVPQKWVSGKDYILALLGQLGVDGALYKVLEFGGSAVRNLPMSGRFTMCNMAIEAGAKTGIIEPDGVAVKFIEVSAERPYEIQHGDSDAAFERTIKIDVSGLEPQVALPYLPSNVKPVSQVSNIVVDQVFIGSCTNGSLDDLRVAAKILDGKKVHPAVRLIVLPTTPTVYINAIKEGLIEKFVKAGAAIGPCTCGPCLGGHMGILARGERACATSNRNFVGRMGHPESEVYLASPAVAAATAIAGKIVHPEEVVGEVS